MVYKDMHLTDLRRYARSIGVKSPTSFTKIELIKKIIEIEKGEVEPYFSKCGRPVMNGKTNIKLEEIIGEDAEPLVTDSNLILYVIKRAKKFLSELEKEIKENKQY